MKKILPLRFGVLIPMSAALALIFLLVTWTPVRAANKCQVCHNTNNPHTVEIPCDQVKKYLADHPGDYAGACQNVTKEKSSTD